MSQVFFDEGKPAVGRQKVLLATPVYENTDASYTYSIQRSREALHAEDIETAYYLMSGGCHVDDNRNTIVKEFLLTDCTDLVFLDADVSWSPEDLVALCQADADLVGGVYPFRTEDKYRRGSMPFLPKQGAKVRVDGLLEVDGLPTGFMRN